MSGLFEKALEKLEQEERHDADAPVRRRPAARSLPPQEPESPVVEANEQPVEPVAARSVDRATAEPPVVDHASPPPAVETAEELAPVVHPPEPAAVNRAPRKEATAAAAPAPTVEAAAKPQPAAPSSQPGSSNYADIELEKLGAAGFITPTSADTTLSEQHRMIKRPLLLKAFPPSGKRAGNENVILVTSSIPEEGKTFVSINLALSIAMEVDRTVLLVDGDPAKGNVTRLLNIRAERGLTDYLASGDVTLPDVLVRTNVPNLSVLPAGKHVSNVTELFSSDQMKRLTEELANRYADRVIIIDSAPLLAASGTRVLAGLAGQILFVVEAVRTTQSAVREALHMIETHPNIGLVLNKSRERPRAAYQYGYYGSKP